MATTFAGTAFAPVGDNPVALPERALAVSTRHIPFSNLNVTDIGGLGPLTYATPIRIAFSALATWQALLGTTGTLVIDGVSYGTMVMTKLGSPKRTLHSEYVMADAEWVEST